MKKKGAESEELLENGSSLAEGEHGDKASPRKSPSDNVPLDSIESLRAAIASDVLTDPGRKTTTFPSPFSVPVDVMKKNPNCRSLQLPLVYCDQTASNRPCTSIERYMEQVCLPLYGNTHTNTSITSSQSTAFVAEARQIVAEQTNAKITGKASLDVVLFAGQGTTSAVDLLIDCLGLAHAAGEDTQRPVVFVGPYEHHSNLIPWRESGCEIVMVPECQMTRQVDLEALTLLLRKPDYRDRMKMGTFTAASNVTGKVCDVDQIAATLHKHGALAFFDYATGAPYMSTCSMNMNPPPSEKYPSASLIAKDAMFFSPHKMLGGIGTPGVLVVKKSLVSQVNAPRRSGGGTVFYVSNTHHRFLSNRIERYEGGTPNVAGIVRVGLTFLLKRQAEERYKRLYEQQTDADIPPTIQDYDSKTYQRVASYLCEHAPNLVLLGYEPNGGNLPIFSFLIRFGKRFLHYNYVCAILNDVFGIQSRGGCQCSGPYSQRLLGLTEMTADGEVPNAMNKDVENALLLFKERAELLRPGYTRISLPFKGLRTEEVDFVLKALVWVAENGWALMCQYRCNHRTGEWRHSSRQGKPLGRSERRWLSHFDFFACQVQEQRSTSAVDEKDLPSVLNETLSNADAILRAAKNDRRSIVEAQKMTDAEAVLGKDDFELEKLRWYAYPKECASILSNGPVESCDMTEEPSLGAVAPLPTPKISKGREENEVLSERKRKPAAIAEDTKKLKTDMQVPNTQKKAFRDISTWGKGIVLPPPIRSETAAQDVNTATAPKDDAMYTEETRVESPRVPATVEPKKKKHPHVKPPGKMMRLVTQAVIQWDMLKDGDRLLLGLSGGKDSLSLLHCLMEIRRKLPINFDIEVCTIDPMTPSFDPSPLIPYVESLGLKYHYVRDEIVSRATSAGSDGKIVSSLCAFCARMKRGNLYSTARIAKCNKLVLAQHLDDCAESLMMSMMHNGFLRTMKANYQIDTGEDLRVIRPMVYCRESLMTEFAKSASLPVINENCPACFEEPKERARIKKMLSREETIYPNFYDNIRRSLIPLMHDDLSSILRCYTEETIARSRKTGHSKGRDSKPRRSEDGAQLSASSPAEVDPASHASLGSVRDISDVELVKELARRKVAKLRQSTDARKEDSRDLQGKVDPANSKQNPNFPGLDSIFLFRWVQSVMAEYRKIIDYFLPGQSARG